MNESLVEIANMTAQPDVCVFTVEPNKMEEEL